MITLSDLMHDVGGEYTKFKIGSFDVLEDLTFLVKDGCIVNSELDPTISKSLYYLGKVKGYMALATGLIVLAKPLIDDRAGSNHKIYSLIPLNVQIAKLAAEALKNLEKNNLKEISEPQLIEIIKSSQDYIVSMRDYVSQAEKIFFDGKEDLYKIIGKDTEIAFGNGYSLMLLDDEPDICVFLKSILTKRGFKVESAISAQSGMDLAFKFQPKIALLDIKLGDNTVNGIEVLKFIKKEIPKCKSFMLTMVDDKYMLDKCIEFGAKGSLSKPINNKEIISALFKAIKELLNES